jgi:hypothetical protein
MNYTKENVENFWKVLNTSQSVDEKKVADEYLIQFKVNRNILIVQIEISSSTRYMHPIIRDKRCKHSIFCCFSHIPKHKRKS